MNYSLFSVMHIHKHYSQSSACDYFDTISTLAFAIMTEINSLLTHAFHIANDNGFQFFGYPIGRRRTDGSVQVVMCLLYPPTCSMLEDHLNINPSLDLDVQLVTHLMLMMEKTCPECILHTTAVTSLMTYLIRPCASLCI